MRGALISVLCHWDGQIIHNHRGDRSKAHRYSIGIKRFNFLRRNLMPFALKDITMANGENVQEVAYLLELEDGDEDPGMTAGTKYEYLAGHKTTGGEFRIFSYIWFASLDDAKAYAGTKHNMKILAGWQ